MVLGSILRGVEKKKNYAESLKPISYASAAQIQPSYRYMLHTNCAKKKIYDDVTIYHYKKKNILIGMLTGKKKNKIEQIKTLLNFRMMVFSLVCVYERTTM